jgi:hypothetical protein
VSRVVTQDKHIAPPPDFVTRLERLERLLQGITNLSGDASGQLPNVQVNTVEGGYPPAIGGLGWGGLAGAGVARTNVSPGGYQVISGATSAITVRNPNGALVRVVGGCSGFAGATATTIDLYWQLDGGTWLLTSNHVGHFDFSSIGQHQWLGSFDSPVGPLAAGVHHFDLNVQVTAGSFSRDANDWASIFYYELP